MTKFVYVAGAEKKTLQCRIREIRAKFQRVETVDATQLTTKLHLDKLESITRERQMVTSLLRKKMKATTSAVERYDIEYHTASELLELTGEKCWFDDTHYWYDSPILHELILRRLLNGAPRDVRILEIGCGSGALIRKIKSLMPQADLFGIDVSQKAIQRVRQMGVRGACGRLEKLIGTRSGVQAADAVFLSYMTDRDENQRATFKTAADLLQEEGGCLVLEGLFPCVLEDSNGVSYGKANVTRGVDAVEDIELVVAEMERLNMRFRTIYVGQRLVYSLDGPEILPSYTMFFQTPPFCSH